jgi:hypothetical protein
MHTVATALFTFVVKILGTTTMGSLMTPDGLKALKLVYRNVY